MEHCRIAIKVRRKIVFVDAEDVIAVEARGNYVVIRQAASSLLLRESISTMEEKLSPLGFVRIHRSSVVNAAWVEEIHPNSGRDYMVQIKDGKQYTVSREYKKNLHLLARSWVGTNGMVAE